MGSKTVWILFAVSACLIGLYPAVYGLLDPSFGLLSTKPTALLNDPVWNAAFYAHIVPGGIALLAGWSQFSAALRSRRPRLHRILGRVYVISVGISGLAGVYIAHFATGGLVSVTGFLALAVVWLLTTFRALQHILAGRVQAHRTLMIYSYAACFAAVTLRIWLPLLTALTGDFFIAYPIVAWLCWVPNLAVAAVIVKRKGAD